MVRDPAALDRNDVRGGELMEETIHDIDEVIEDLWVLHGRAETRSAGEATCQAAVERLEAYKRAARQAQADAPALRIGRAVLEIAAVFGFKPCARS